MALLQDQDRRDSSRKRRYSDIEYGGHYRETSGSPDYHAYHGYRRDGCRGYSRGSARWNSRGDNRKNSRGNYRGNSRDDYRGNFRDNNRGDYSRDGYRGNNIGDYRSNSTGDHRGNHRDDYRGNSRYEVNRRYDYRGNNRDDYRGNSRDDYRGNNRDGHRGNSRDDYRGNNRDDHRSNHRDDYQGSNRSRDDYRGNSRDDYQGNDYRGNNRDDYRGNSRDDYRGNNRDDYRGNSSDDYRGNSTDDYRGNKTGDYRGTSRDNYRERRDGPERQGQDAEHMSELLLSTEYGQQPQARDRSESQGRRVEQHTMGYIRLQKLVANSETDVLFTITNEQSGFLPLLNQHSLTPDFVSLMLSAACKGCLCRSSPNSWFELLNKLRVSSFLTHIIPKYISGIDISGMAMEKSVQMQRTYRGPLNKLMLLMRELLEKMPASVPQVVPVIDTLEFVLRPMGTVSSVVDEQLNTQLSELISLRDEMITTRPSLLSSEMVGDVNGSSTDDFRTIAVFPTMHDIHEKESPFLRANKTEGRYESMNHYLDVQFRLLKEDFVAPLRDGIHEYLSMYSSKTRQKNLQDIRLYHEVHVLNPVCTPTGIAHRICFYVRRISQIRWESTKRLIFGSLVCLSKDHFQTMLFATVSDRQPKHLQNGEVEVIFEHNNQEVSTIAPDETFLMVETSAYFEAYRHVLKGLQEIPDDSTFPFYNYIVKCERNVVAPQYLQNANAQFDLQFLVEGEPHDGHHQELKLNERNWPDARSLNLDRSQYDALKAALTREFTLIQGPPGTGKTFLGLKIVSVLLKNKFVWCKPDVEDNPILVVCYTNHALDQFLEGIHKFSPSGIVRVGGRSASRVLEQYYLKKLRQKIRERRAVSRILYEGRVKTKQEMDSLRIEIERTGALIEVSERGLLREDVLKPYIGEQLFQCLRDAGPTESNRVFKDQDKPSVLPNWLEIWNSTSITATEGMDMSEIADDNDPEDSIGTQRDKGALAGLEDDLFVDLEQDMREIHRRAAEATLAGNFDEITHVGSNQSRPRHKQIGQKRRKIELKELKSSLRSTDVMAAEDVGGLNDPWDLPMLQRWRLYRYWLTKYRRTLRQEIQQSEHKYHEAAERMKEVLNQEDKVIMKGATVIGMTTTAAARYRLILQEIRPKIIVIEEAAEVLEAHIVTTLSAGCEHLILIGDHKQLRPSPNVYKLAERYNLKISLFERMFKNGVPCEILETQHRMRPEISCLLKHIYPELKDHKSVKAYENVRGVAKNIFFVTHDHEENMILDTKSRYNEHEAKFTSALCRYLLLQGYNPHQITVLTLYTGQLIQLKKCMPKATFGGVRVTAVDNFQGEENDIILLSLVRSNTENNIGFLREDNRVCVALSRARIGFYAIGNLDLFVKKSNLWRSVVDTLQKMGCSGEELQLSCQNHPRDSQMPVSCDKDFEKAPEGGCLLPCDSRLPCGHVCLQVCHTYDKEHKEYRCRRECRKELCGSGHLCSKQCYEKCGPCGVVVETLIPACGHRQNIPCHMPVSTFSCLQKVNKSLDCGHRYQDVCGRLLTYKCRKVITEVLPCGHTVHINCNERQNGLKCGVKCEIVLDCGHPCTGTCDSCFMTRLHTSCKAKCNRTLVCGHACKDWCTKDCPPCSHKCENKCVHSRCIEKCGEPCAPCVESCSWRCKHFRCTRLCHEPCDRPRCNAPCEKKLPCGHPCIGLCDEKCPTKCRVCDKAIVEEILLGTEISGEGEPLPRYVQLEDCGHVLEIGGLDRWMEVDDHDQKEDQTIQLKTCPKCKTTIRKNARYAILINAILKDIEQVKGRILGQREKVNAARRKVITNLAQLERKDFSAAKDLKDRLHYNYLTIEAVVAIAKASSFINHLSGITVKAQESINTCENQTQKKRLMDIISQAEAVRSWALQNTKRFSDQQLREGSQEINRVSLLCQTRLLQNGAESKQDRFEPSVKHELYMVIMSLTDGIPLTEDREKQIRTQLEKLREQLQLGITDEERVHIVNALARDLSKGHWFKCPKGHIYGIGNCGGATTSGKCPECGSAIGGGSYRLNEGNTLATEMDGAERAAWSTMT